MSDEVNKVTLYMTPEQWRALSAWNVKHLEKGEETWLFMSHKSDGREEYLAEMASFKEGVDRTLEHMYGSKDAA
jgi:hypothetical protein